MRKRSAFDHVGRTQPEIPVGHGGLPLQEAGSLIGKILERISVAPTALSRRVDLPRSLSPSYERTPKAVMPPAVSVLFGAASVCDGLLPYQFSTDGWHGQPTHDNTLCHRWQSGRLFDENGSTT